jgi:hypothetical protein
MNVGKLERICQKSNVDDFMLEHEIVQESIVTLVMVVPGIHFVEHFSHSTLLGVKEPRDVRNPLLNVVYGLWQFLLEEMLDFRIAPLSKHIVGTGNNNAAISDLKELIHGVKTEHISIKDTDTVIAFNSEIAGKLIPELDLLVPTHPLWKGENLDASESLEVFLDLVVFTMFPISIAENQKDDNSRMMFLKTIG